MELIVAADPVRLTQMWLAAHLDADIDVVKNRPAPIAGQVVVVRRSGGVATSMVTDSPWLTVEIFAPTERSASDLAHLTWGLLRAMGGEIIDGVQCYPPVATLAAPADMPLTDPAEGQRPRWVMTVQPTFRASRP